MPKNKGKGGKNRRRGKNDTEGEKRELNLKEAGQEYGQVVKMLGSGRLEAYCFDGVKRLCHIRGKMRKKVWVNAGDIILISLRDYQDQKADVILKYNPDEARQLKAQGELPENAKINDVDVGGGFDSGDEDDIEFQEDEGVNIENVSRIIQGSYKTDAASDLWERKYNSSLLYALTSCITSVNVEHPQRILEGVFQLPVPGVIRSASYIQWCIEYT